MEMRKPKKYRDLKRIGGRDVERAGGHENWKKVEREVERSGNCVAFAMRVILGK